MDKEWVYLDRRSDDYMAGLHAFINNSLLVASFEGKIKCPCVECYNKGWTSPKEVEDHLKVDGMDEDYLNGRWKWHGELLPMANMGDPPEGGGDIRAMLHDAFGMHGLSPGDNVDQENAPLQNPTPDAEKFYRLLEECKTELYPGCGKTKLDFILQLYQIKAINCWTDVSFTALMNMLKSWFPEANLPTSFYHTKKLITDLSLPYVKIDVCPKDCMLFWKDHADDEKCTKCGAKRYKSKTRSRGNSSSRVANKVLRYFPLGPRLQRLYMSCHTAQNMVWHSEERPEDEVLRHPADSPAWKHLDTMYPSFGSEARNVRLGLASDGFNPFGMMSLSHSTWPVVMSVYNLPPWLCMKQPYLMLSLLIPGPKGPGKDIDVFLQPLVDELKSLWNEGIPTYDAFKKETFDMRAAVLWTINDFPAYAMLSGWSTKGKFACPQCAFGTKSIRLKHGRKECYLGHRRWLPMSHKFRLFRKPFDGNIEMEQPPIPMTGTECLDSLRGLKFEYGKGDKNKGVKRRRGKGKRKKEYAGPWKKKSIFFNLPYWKDLLLRHNLDVMHIEKNVTESVMGTLLGMDGKNKDSLNARLDLLELNCKPKYHPKVVGGRTVYDPMPFTLKPAEKSMICEVLSLVLLPDGFGSNLARCVRKLERKLVGLKSHDCHIIMQYLLPLAIRHSLPKESTLVLLELSSFFRNLCTKVGTAAHFDDLSRRIALTLCHLERLMPPAFFDVMVHLTVHLAEEAKIAGPVQYRWMYPIERYLHTLKKYVRNRNRPEASIAIGYIIEETLGFCALYFGDEVVTKRNRPGRNADAAGSGTRQGLSIFAGHGRSLGFKQLIHLEHLEWERAHRAVLFGCPEVTEYISQHEKLIMDSRLPRESLMAAQARAHLEFPGWFGTHEALDWSDPETLQLQEDIKEVVVDKLHERWKSFKYKLKKKWYKPFRGMEKRFVCGNKQVHEGQWRVLVTRWDATKNQEVAETNTTNRQQLKLHQTTGTKTYAQLRYQWECQHPGEVLDRVTFFALAYDANKKDLTNPQLSNEEAQKKYDKLQELENIVRNEGREVTHEVRNELFNKVMGPEKRNRVRGYGIGAKWVDVPGIVTQKSGVTHQLKALSESYEAHRESSEKREEVLTQQLKECAEREEAMRADFVQLNKKLDALQAQMVPNPLTQILAADGKASMEKLDLCRLIDLLTKADNLQDMSTSNVEMGNNSSQNCTT